MLARLCLAIDASNGTLWANSQAVGTAISYTLNQLASGTGATTPNVAVSGATEANIGYGGVAFAGGGTAPAPKPVISSFTVTPPNLGVGGGNVTLAWNVTGATSLSIDQGVGVVTGSSTTRNVSSTTTFTLTATNANGSTLSSPTTVTVAVPVGNPVENDTSFTVTGLGTTQTRTSKYRVSGQPAPANGRPLVIFLHGNGGVINQVPQDYKTWTDQQAAVLVAPQGLLDNGVTSWRFRMDGKNDAGTAAGVDDVAFIQEIITRATSAANPLFGAGNKVDPNKVFVVGESRGAGMAYYLYADPRTKNLISAIAPISGTFYCATSNGGNGNVPYNPPADSDFNCGENGGFGFFGPKASLYARATPPRLFNIHGTNDLASTPAPALNNEYGSLILMTKQWATTANNCGTSLPAANPVFSNANIAGKTVTAYRQRNQANNAPCPADVTFFIVQDGGHVPQGYAERIVKWFFGQYNTQTNVFN